MAKLLLLVAATLLGTASAASPTVTLLKSMTPTAYEMLGWYNLLRGILPQGMQSYVLQPDGSFEVYLPSDCQFKQARKYTLHYSSRVTGGISVSSISRLEGVKLKVGLMWLSIRQVDRDGDELRLHVGPFTKSLSVDHLNVSPRCNGGWQWVTASTAETPYVVVSP